MNQNLMFAFIFQFSPLPSFCFFILFLLPIIALANVIDPFYQACSESKTCGDGQIIKYPFYIQGQQQPFCGYPGFQVACNNKGNPVLNLNGSDYNIHEIFYKNQTLSLSNAAVSETNICEGIPLIRNLSLNDEQLELVSNKTEVFLLHNCSSSLPENLSRYKAGNCENESNTVLALYKSDPNLDYAPKVCRSTVLAPVDVYEDDFSEFGIEEILKRGFALKYIVSDCSVCESSGGKCGFNASTYHFKCFCPDRPHAAQCPPVPGKVKGVSKKVTAAITVTGLGVLILLAFCIMKKISWNKSAVFWKKKTKNHHNIEVFLRNYGSLAPKRYTYLDIKKMTNSFKHKLGQGGYGGVYKGKLLDGRIVAVKLLNEAKGNGEEFINEVASISRTSHVNIVTLLGFCFEGRKRALIYEFVCNGSLEKFIYDKNKLDNDHRLRWETLYQIAVGIARGLEYLHRGCNTRILHFDIKPHNILLDEDFCPKISDFGLAKICPRKESVISMTGARGTVGYIAPEVFCRNFGEVSHKSDVYSYGMMVLEMVGGRKNMKVEVDHSSEIYFPHCIYNRLELDEDLGLQGISSEEDKDWARKMIIVSLWCIQTNPWNRPTISRVVEMLEGSLCSLQIPPKPFLTSPTTPARDSSAAVIC